MHAVIPVRRAMRGFTLIEIMIGIVILSILLAVGIPTMSQWLAASRALSTAEFYAEGLRMARGEALKHNAESRFTLTANANGQYDWQIDLCLPGQAAKCDDNGGNWSTPTVASTDAGLTDYKSVVRSASTLPKKSLVAVTLNTGADQVYFTPLGWIDSTIATPLTMITIAPPAARAGSFPTSAVAVTLAGTVSKCDPTILSSVADSRKCPQ